MIFIGKPLTLHHNQNNNDMAANLFGRYVWLVDILLRYRRLTFQEISDLWQNSGLS